MAVVLSQQDDTTADPAANGHKHISFGYGIHRCIGSHLGHTEARNALAALLAAVPAVPHISENPPPARRARVPQFQFATHLLVRKPL